MAARRKLRGPIEKRLAVRTARRPFAPRYSPHGNSSGRSRRTIARRGAIAVANSRSPRRADLSAPSSKHAAAEADAEIRRRYGVSSIDPASPTAAEMRKAWMDAYVDDGGILKGV